MLQNEAYLKVSLAGDLCVGKLNIKVDWSGWSYSQELLATLTSESWQGAH